eukprot:9907044-Prorocentrum_lima.AAC.1
MVGAMRGGHASANCGQGSGGTGTSWHGEPLDLSQNDADVAATGTPSAECWAVGSALHGGL